MRWRGCSSSGPLDLGECLWLASRAGAGEEWAAGGARRAAGALEALWGAGYFRQAAANRLAFRKFGATLGAQAHPATARRWAARVDALHEFWAPLAFGRDPDITPVMLASSLLPGAWLRGFDARARREA